MTSRVDLNRPILPVSLPKNGSDKPVNHTGRAQASFQDILTREMQPGRTLKFSRHAEERLAGREVAFTAGDLSRLHAAVEKAASKGARDALVLINDVALVVSITNRTVVTVVDGASMKENVFTNIDSAVIV